jgi:hypothetical protein
MTDSSIGLAPVLQPANLKIHCYKNTGQLTKITNSDDSRQPRRVPSEQRQAEEKLLIEPEKSSFDEEAKEFV